jgi:hypothetical protein
MPEIGTSGSMSGDGKRGVAEWPKLPRPSSTLPKRTCPSRQSMSAYWGEADSRRTFLKWPVMTPKRSLQKQCPGPWLHRRRRLVRSLHFLHPADIQAEGLDLSIMRRKVSWVGSSTGAATSLQARAGEHAWSILMAVSPGTN